MKCSEKRRFYEDLPDSIQKRRGNEEERNTFVEQVEIYENLR